MIGDLKAAPVPRAVIEALTEVQVNASATSQSGFQLKFTLGKNSVIAKQLLPSGYFGIRRRVIITATVRGTAHVLMDGIITKLDLSPSPESGESVFSVTGVDLSAVMDFVDLTGIPYPAAIPSGIVGLILAKYSEFGISPRLIPNPVTFFSNPFERFPKQNGTDLSYIKQLAGEIGYIFYIDPGPRPGSSIAYWGPEIRHGRVQKPITMNMDAANNASSISFSYDGLARSHQVVTILRETDPKIPIPIPIPNFNPLKPDLARESAATLKVNQTHFGTAKMNAAQAAQIGVSAILKSSDAVVGNGQLDVLRYGNVLKPRQLVSVRGVTDMFNGRYYVKSVTHNIKRGSFTQSFSLGRGGIKSDISRVAP